MPGKLFIVPTPVGNLEDITMRAIRTLQEVDLILAEDTRTSGVLLKHFKIEKPLRSYHQHNEHNVLEQLSDELRQGRNLALISDAGTPGISDPGFLLIRHVLAQGIEVTTLPGATAFVPALVSSGFPCNEFSYYGFLPQKKGRQTKLKQLALEEKTFILYESPFRIQKLFGELEEYIGADRRACISREISKVFEEHLRGTIGEIHLALQRKPIKGEIVVVVEGLKFSEEKNGE